MHGRRIAVVAAMALVVAFLCTAFAVAAPAPTQEQNMAKLKAAPDTAVVAVVAGQNITKSELMSVLWDWMAPSTLDEYLNYKVIAAAMKKRGIAVSKADIDAKMAEAKKSLPPGETLDSMMQKMKYPMARFKAGLIIQIGLEKIVEKDNAPTQAEYADYIQARHILVSVPRSAPDAKPEDTKKAEDDAKVKADKIYAELKAGKSFEAAAKEYSDDPGSKEKGGELGWFTKGRMVPEFSDAAFAMKVGETSQPVKSPYGYHIIQVEASGQTASAKDKAELKKQIMQSKMQTLMRPMFEKLKEEAKVQNKMSPTIPEGNATGAAPKPAVKPAAKPAPKTAPAKAGSEKLETPPPAPK